MDLSSHVLHSDLLATRTSKMLSSIDTFEQIDSPQFQGNSHVHSRTDDRGGRVNHTIDIAKILRGWTHALQHIHEQSLHMAKANDAEDPALHLMSENGSDGHTEYLAATLAEHQQHLVSLEGLVNQLKAAVPTMQKSILELTEEVNTISPISLEENREQSSSPAETQCSGRTPENTTGAIFEMTFSVSLKASDKPVLKLLNLFNITPNWSRKTTHKGKHHSVFSHPEKSENLLKDNSIAPLFGGDPANFTEEDSDIYAQNLRRAVREAALSGPSNNSENAGDKTSNASLEHFFISLSSDFPHKEGVVDLLFSSSDSEESLEQVFSSSYLKDEPVFDDCYEDLLGMYSPSKFNCFALSSLPSIIDRCYQALNDFMLNCCATVRD